MVLHPLVCLCRQVRMCVSSIVCSSPVKNVMDSAQSIFEDCCAELVVSPIYTHFIIFQWRNNHFCDYQVLISYERVHRPQKVY